MKLKDNYTGENVYIGATEHSRCITINVETVGRTVPILKILNDGRLVILRLDKSEIVHLKKLGFEIDEGIVETWTANHYGAGINICRLYRRAKALSDAVQLSRIPEKLSRDGDG